MLIQLQSTGHRPHDHCSRSTACHTGSTYNMRPGTNLGGLKALPDALAAAQGGRPRHLPPKSPAGELHATCCKRVPGASNTTGAARSFGREGLSSCSCLAEGSSLDIAPTPLLQLRLAISWSPCLPSLLQPQLYNTRCCHGKGPSRLFALLLSQCLLQVGLSQLKTPNP